MFRIRYLCFAYAAGLLGVVQFGLNLASGWQPEGWLGSITEALRALDMPALLVLAALLHLGEAMLVRLQVSMASPLLFEGKRGKLVGGYQLQHFWPIPMLILVPVTGSGAELAWSPLLNAGGGYMLMALPILLGFGEVTQSMLPGQRYRYPPSGSCSTGQACLCSVSWRLGGHHLW